MNASKDATSPPSPAGLVAAAGTVEAWAYGYVTTRSLEEKLSPPPPPGRWRDEGHVAPSAPGRPAGLRVMAKAPRMPRKAGTPAARAKLLHTFLHHELQAAELMAWALLAFPSAPAPFRQGLLAILQDELRHAADYRVALEELGVAYGDHPVRDWFWERVPRCRTPASFVATLGLGLEAANLEHTARFAALFRAAGDEAGARLQERIGQEEIAHVAFGVRWFEAFRGSLRFEDWSAALPPPLSPLLMRGTPVARDARRRAGMSDAFVGALEAWRPAPCAP
ncbi:MAG: DUF455 family protein [Myxococcota bacterium]